MTKGPVAPRDRALLRALLGPALLLAACGSSAPDAGGLSVGFAQSSDSENRHALDVTIRNDGEGPVHVLRLQLRTPLYEDVAPVAFDDEIRPGSQTTFPVPYGRATCRDDDGGSAVVVVSASGPDGNRDLRVPVAADEPLLSRLTKQECRLTRLQETVEVAFAPGWERVGDQVEATIVLRRLRGQDDVRLVEVDGSQVFTMTARGPLPLAAPVELGRTAEVPVVVTLPACAPHQIIESKRNAIFNLTVEVGRDPLLLVQASADADGKAVLSTLVEDVCRAAGVVGE